MFEKAHKFLKTYGPFWLYAYRLTLFVFFAHGAKRTANHRTLIQCKILGRTIGINKGGDIITGAIAIIYSDLQPVF